MSELSFSVMCLNVDVQTKNHEIIIKYLKDENCDLYFLQEVKSIKIIPCYKDKLANIYDVIYLKENQKSGSAGSHPCSCLFYNKYKFTVIKEDEILYALDEDSYTDHKKPEILKEFEEKLIHGDHDSLKKRASLAILQCNSSDTSGVWSPRIIVVSYHGPRYSLSDDVIQSNATQLFTALDYLGQATGCPVLIAGDFNCDLLKMKVNTIGFIVPSYNPTIHRLRVQSVHNDCIDFFAYKNYAGCTEIEVVDVSANLVIKDDNDSIVRVTGAGQYHKYESSVFSILMNTDNKCKVSDHDPLRATLTVKRVLPTLTISYYNINNNQNAVDYINHISDLVIVNNIATPKKLNGMERMWLDYKAAVFYNGFKLEVSKCDVPISYLNLCYDNLKIFFTLIHKDVTEDEINKLNKLTAGCNAVIVMGDFNSTKLPGASKNLPLVIQQCESPHDEFFIAYMNGTLLTTGVVTPLRLLCIHSTIKTIHKIDKTDFSIIEDVTLPHHQALLNFGSSITLPHHHFQINVLYFNMEFKDTSKMSISSYFTGLNPKPDLFILQDTAQKFRTEIEVILGIDKLTHNTCCESTIVYNSNLFQLITELEFVYSQPSSSQDIPADNNNNKITACIFKCLKIVGNPEVIVASFYNFTDKRCFNLFCKIYPTHPILIAGGFNVELDTLKNDNNNFRFEVMECEPTILKILQKKVICRDSFAYKSSAKSHIKLEDVHAETIPYQDIRTTIKNCINYDKGVDDCLPDVKIEHDPIRAKLTILEVTESPALQDLSTSGEHKASSTITSSNSITSQKATQKLSKTDEQNEHTDMSDT